MGEVVIPKLGKKFGYVVTRKYREGEQELRQIIAFYVAGGQFFVAQWCRNADGSGDYKHFKNFEISREEYFWNFYYENQDDEVPRPERRSRAPREKGKEKVKS